MFCCLTADNDSKTGNVRFSKYDQVPFHHTDIIARNGERGNEEEESQNIAKNDGLVIQENDESLSKRLLNYTAMTLPCVDFPAMKKRNQAAAESNSVIIPPLHVTVSFHIFPPILSVLFFLSCY